jgi:FolB domain-containing protein
MHMPFGAAAATDDLTKTIDYAALREQIMDWGEDREWRLIETLAVDLAEFILTLSGRLQKITVRVEKFILPNTRSVSVRVTRSR